MDYFNFEEASNAIPPLDLDHDLDLDLDLVLDTMEIPGTNIIQPMEDPNLLSKCSGPGSTVKLKLANDRVVDAILWDHDLSHEFPMYRAKEPCQVCARMGMDCFLASRGALITGCTCCISLFRECSFIHGDMPKGHFTTFAGISEESQVCHGPMQQWKPVMRSYEGERTRKTGSRFPRDAVKILKQWLTEHNEHPYPNEREKDELKQLTGLKRSQIANWLANARRRGKVRPTSGPASPMLGAIDIPDATKSVTDLNPLDRWKASPPENEPALMTDIARAIGNTETPSSKSSHSDMHHSRASSRRASSEDDSSFSMFRAPSVSSFETRESSNSDFSFASSRSQRSKISLASSQDRRRRRRAPMTQRVAAQATKPKGTRPFQCTFCTDTFATKYDWQRHEKSLHLALERWICCPTGGSVEVPGTPERKCVFCSQPNPSLDHLETHNFTACQEKSIQERTFYRKDHLRQHLKLMHNTRFVPAMEAWKSTTTEIKSQCGFCPSRFSTWQQRADHLAAHFRNGVDMVNWQGNWGFEPHIEKVVEDAIPPYLIAFERLTMNPFVAKSRTSPSSATPGLSQGTSVDGSEKVEPDQLAKDGNCWYRLEDALTSFVNEQTAKGIIPSDKVLQDYGRKVIYGANDEWDWTCADNQIWLDAFKYQVGIGPAPTDPRLQETRTVPILAPYVVKGGLKTKGVIREAACPTADPPALNSLGHTPIEGNMFALNSAEEFDPNMELDFEGVDFNALDLGGFDETNFDQPLGKGLPSSDFELGAQYAPAQSHGGFFDSFDLSTDSSQKYGLDGEAEMSVQDFDQLTGYMAGFQQKN